MAGFLYTSHSGNPSYIIRIKLSDFTRNARLNLSSGNNSVSCLALDSNGGFLYAGCNTNPGRVIKIQLSDFTEFATLTSSLGGRNYFYKDLLIDIVNGFLYAQSGAGLFPTIKIRLSDFTEINSLTWSFGGVDPSQGVINTNSGFAYIGSDASYISKINLNSFTYINYSGLGNVSQSSCIDLVNNKGYWGLNTSPGRIVKVDLITMTIDSTLILPSGYGTVTAQVIDSNNGFIYGGTYDAPAKIIKIRLSDFTLFNTITLNTGENFSCYDSAIDIINGYAYFAVLTSPTKIIKVRLSDFTREATLTLNTGEASLLSMSIDPILFIPGVQGGGGTGSAGGGASGRRLKARYTGRSLGR